MRCQDTLARPTCALLGQGAQGAQGGWRYGRDRGGKSHNTPAMAVGGSPSPACASGDLPTASLGLIVALTPITLALVVLTLRPFESYARPRQAARRDTLVAGAGASA